MIRVRPIFTLVVLALFPFFIGLVGLLDPTATTPKMSNVIVAGVAFLVILTGLAYEARRDLWRTASFVVWMCTAPVLVASVILAVAETSSSRWRAAGVGLPFLILALTCLVFVIRSQRATDDLPNPLLERFPKSRIWEAEAVQWTGVSSMSVVTDGALLSIFLQNCVAAPRRVQITLQDAAGLLMRSGGLTWPALAPIALGPGDDGVLHVPIAATGARRGDVQSTQPSRPTAGPEGASVARMRPSARSASVRGLPSSGSSAASSREAAAFDGPSQFREFLRLVRRTCRDPLAGSPC